MTTKHCNECHEEKSPADFYANYAKCKTCICARVAARRLRLEASDPQWVEAEAARHREKSRRYRGAGRTKPEAKAIAKMRTKKFRADHPLAAYAHGAVEYALRAGRLTKQPCERCGSEDVHAHHEDYSKPLDVIWLCITHHAERHVEINRERRLARFASRSE
jgi:hypothetical protein